ncbi:MAG: hypothetical protein VX764_08890 [Planctomycetota bacterium]|nr:hypothetical protein [Planctomycetota bacterium]
MRKVHVMKTPGLFLLLFCALALVGAQDPPLMFYSNADRISTLRKNDPEMYQRILAPVQAHMEAYFDGDMAKLQKAWKETGVVQIDRTTFEGEQSKVLTTRQSISAWISEVEVEIKKLGLEDWKLLQRKPQHDLILTVLSFTSQGALVLVENPMAYSMGPDSEGDAIGDKLLLFKVFHNAYPKDATIQQMTLGIGNGC